jgi:hypothetical protein
MGCGGRMGGRDDRTSGPQHPGRLAEGAGGIGDVVEGESGDSRVE